MAQRVVAYSYAMEENVTVLQGPGTMYPLCSILKRKLANKWLHQTAVTVSFDSIGSGRRW